jgi:ATP-binding cassette subfamily B protein
MTTITIVALIVVILLVMLYVIPKFIKIQKTADKMNLVSRENLSGVRVIRAFNAENHQKKQFESVNRQNFKLNTGLHRTMGILFPLITLFISGLVLGIYLMAAALIDNGGLQPLSASSVISTFVQLSVNILFAVLQCVMFFTGLPRGIVSFKRINEVMNTKLPISDPAKPVYFKGKGTVEFKNVSFAYKGADGKVLSNISLKIERGQTVAFIGSTGCGKSTLVNLIPRFADVSKGQILVDGVDIRNVKQDDLHNIIGFVPQRSSLFTGTVASNIKFGKNMNDEKMVIAAKIAQADEFINKLPKKYNSEVAQGGTNFSGGQKQRLCIARALALEPEIFIFDDSFSALDYRTDQIVRAEIKNKMKDVTNIIVAQRIGTILNADNIFVIDKGRIVGEGTHNELMKNCKVYQQIAYSQLSTTELDKISQGGTRV